MTFRSARLPCAVSLAGALALSSLGCGPKEEPYQARPAPSGAKPNLPPVPNVPKSPVKAGDAYTVWGASYYLRSRVHNKEVAGQKIKITGYVSKTNLPDAPECAVHEGGKADPEGCVAPVPTFWIADSKDATEKDSIAVMGWASNFAQIYDAIEQYEKDEKAKDKSKIEPKVDTFWQVEIPRPLPVKGAKVTVEGSYSTTFVRSTKGTQSDPIMGIVTYQKVTYLEEPTEKATLPGMKKK